jgi:hypothetical protein
MPASPYLCQEFAFPFIVANPTSNRSAPARDSGNAREKVRGGCPIARLINLVDVVDKKRGTAATA